MPDYAMDHTARTTGYVSQGAADYCRANGHAHWIVDGEDQGVCPRCLTITETETANEETGNMETDIRDSHFGDAAIELWELQRDMEAAEILATMGDTVDQARYLARAANWEAARRTFGEAIHSAEPGVISEYLALLTWRADQDLR